MQLEIQGHDRAVQPARASIARAATLFLAGAAIFFALRPLELPGGDTHLFFSANWGYIYGDRFVWYAREPLAHLAVHGLYRLLGNLALAFAVSAAIFGGLYLVVLDRFSRGWRFWLPVLASAATWNFVGHKEYYAPVLAALALFYLALVRALERPARATPAHAMAAFCLAFLAHKGALFFLPAALWLVVGRENGRWKRRLWPRRSLEWALVWIIMIGVAEGFVALLTETGAGILYQTVNEPVIELLTPVNQAMADWVQSRNKTGLFYYFLMFEPLHWKFFFGFLLAGAPVGIPVTIWLWRRIRTDAARALLTAAALGAVWLFLWHPRAGWKDWDLFSLAVLPLNLLAGLLWSGAAAVTPQDSSKA